MNPRTPKIPNLNEASILRSPLSALGTSPLPSGVQEGLENAKNSAEATLFLSRVSLLISSRVDDPKGALSRAARAVIPYLADWCIIDLLEGGTFSRVQLAYRYGEDHETAEIARAKTIAPAMIEALRSSFGSGLPIILGPDSEAIESFAPIRPGSALLAPLINDGRVIGVMSLLLTKSEREFKATQRLIAQEIASRVATVAEASKQFQDSQNAIKVRDQFISVAVHELRNPLTSMKLNAGLLRRMVENDDSGPISLSALRTMTTKIEKSIDRLQMSIDRLFDVSLMRSDQLSLKCHRANLTRLVEESVSRLTTDDQPTRTVKMELTEKVYAIVDPFRIDQVISNLVANAFKYAPQSQVDIKLVTEGDVARISIRDYGKGIMPADQARIFDCFERGTPSTSASGLGLGLFIVKKIIRAHGGEIRVQSEPGQGAEFIIELPVSHPKKEPDLRSEL